MEIDYKKGLTYGLINAGIYLAFPIILISILSALNILQFGSSFLIFLIIFGTIRVFIAFIKNIYRKDSLSHNLIGVGAAIYSGLYLFYIFGGFSINQAFGNYYVESENLSAVFGLQFIAWLMFLAAILNAIYYSLRCINLHKYNLLRKIFQRGGIILYLILAVFLASIIVSGLNLSFPVKENYTYAWDTGANPFIYDDDQIDITVYFDVRNLGLYSVKDITLNGEIFTVNTSDSSQLLLPDNQKIGDITDVHYNEFPGFTITLNANITIGIFLQYVPGLIMHDAVLKLKISLSFTYAGIHVDLNTSILTTWSSLT
ncbi:MAG: hypothetical protein ACTSYB_15055 [Candidatus Helarchaeota archaeon]